MPIVPFDYQPHTRVIFESGGLNRLGECAKQLSCCRALLVTDQGLEAAGHPSRAEALLRQAGLDVVLFDEVHSDPTTADVDRGLGTARSGGEIDLIVGLGGGSSLDCAKGINFLLTNGGSIEDYRGFGKASLPMLPMIGIPTTAGTGSEAQSYAIIARESDHMKMACGDFKAACRIAILDAELTLSMPQSVTAATGIDAMSHALESHVSNRRNPISDLYSREAWNLISRAFPRVMDHPEDVEARGEMLLGAHLAGMAIENSMLGAAHACANPLSAHLGMTHGIAVGLMLPHVIRFNSAVAENLYADLAHVSGISVQGGAGRSLANFVESLFRNAGLQPAISSSNRSLIPQLAAEAFEQWTGKCNPKPVNQSQFEELYQCAFPL